jgi:hypothetical protein
MKKLLVFLSASLFSATAISAEVSVDYPNYKELNMKLYGPGSYSYITTCDTNDLSWDKSTNSYKRVIESTTERGFDIVQIIGDTIKTVSSGSSEHEKNFYESLTTFTSENTFTRTSKGRTILEDGSEYSYDIYTEGTYKNGKVVLSRHVVDGVEKPIKTAGFSVWLDKDGLETYDTSSYIPSEIEAQMADPNYTIVNLKYDKKKALLKQGLSKLKLSTFFSAQE